MKYVLETIDAFTAITEKVSKDWNDWIRAEMERQGVGFLDSGITPDSIKTLPEYREFKGTYDAASSASANMVQYASILFSANALARARREQIATKRAAAKAVETQETLS